MIIIIYCILGYWSVGRTIWANKMVFGSYTQIVSKKIALGLMFGWILIPWALLKMLFRR